MNNIDFNLFYKQLNSEIDNFVKKMKKYEVIEKKDKILVIFNAAGIKEEDIQVTKEEDSYYKDINILVVSGTTFNEKLNKTYSIKERFPIQTNLYKEINYKMEDGLLIIELVKNIVNINKIKINHK